MDQVIVNPGKVEGALFAPASKSSMQRACAAALLCQNDSILINSGASNDDLAALSIIRQLGARVEKLDNKIYQITPVSSYKLEHNIGISAGESGLSVRMFTPITALFDKEILVNGVGSLLTRPMAGFDEIFSQLNIEYDSTDDKLPVRICGPLKPVDIELDGSLSSQYLTGILMAYSAVMASDVTIHVSNLKSKPYIDLTLDVLKAFKMKVPENIDYKSFYFAKETLVNNTETIKYQVEGDWSGASFLLVAGAINGAIELKGLDLNSSQADKAILQPLRDCGANVHLFKDKITLSTAELNAFTFDATECPDLFPPLTALASYCNGVSRIKGIHRLTHKESDRAATLQKEFGKLGVTITFSDDEMCIVGNKSISGGVVDSCHDHRIAMACAVAGIKATSPVIINEPFAINKSYPEFYRDLILLGVDILIPGQ